MSHGVKKYFGITPYFFYTVWIPFFIPGQRGWGGVAERRLQLERSRCGLLPHLGLGAQVEEVAPLSLQHAGGYR